MTKSFKTNHFLALLYIVTPLITFAQEGGDSYRDIEPPPTPIDDYVIPFAFVAILIALFYFYKTNLKTGTK